MREERNRRRKYIYFPNDESWEPESPSLSLCPPGCLSSFLIKGKRVRDKQEGKREIRINRHTTERPSSSSCPFSSRFELVASFLFPLAPHTVIIIILSFPSHSPSRMTARFPLEREEIEHVRRSSGVISRHSVWHTHTVEEGREPNRSGVERERKRSCLVWNLVRIRRAWTSGKKGKRDKLFCLNNPHRQKETQSLHRGREKREKGNAMKKNTEWRKRERRPAKRESLFSSVFYSSTISFLSSHLTI